MGDYIPLHEQGRLTPNERLQKLIEMRIRHNKATPAPRHAGKIEQHTRLCRNPQYRVRLARAHEVIQHG